MKFDVRESTYEINRELFRIRGKYGRTTIKDGEIVLLSRLIHLHMNNKKIFKKNYCDVSNAALADNLYISNDSAGMRIISERIKRLKLANFITTSGTFNRKIFVNFDNINKVINENISNEDSIENKKEKNKKQTEKRLQKHNISKNKPIAPIENENIFGVSEDEFLNSFEDTPF